VRVLERAFQRGLAVRGLHAHVGSQLSGVADHAETIERLSEFAARCRDRFGGWAPEIVDAGGGFAVRHVAGEPKVSIGVLAGAVSEHVLRAWDARGLPRPRVVLEPGRALVGQAGVALYRVRSVKRLLDATWVAVDGGMSDNPRPSLYGARYTGLSATRADEVANETVSLAGLHCESGDVLVDDVSLPSPRVGDLVAVPATGAYTLAMSSNYNATPRPAVVLVRDGRAQLVRRRETVDDLLALELPTSEAERTWVRDEGRR
jgi:diaminopimelate decarboxylase